MRLRAQKGVVPRPHSCLVLLPHPLGFSSCCLVQFGLQTLGSMRWAGTKAPRPQPSSQEEDALTSLMATFEEVQLLCPFSNKETDPEGLHQPKATHLEQPALQFKVLGMKNLGEQGGVT